jgi:hypothetical protein
MECFFEKIENYVFEVSNNSEKKILDIGNSVI